MKGIKKFLKKLDIFGVNLNFKYKADDTYTTALGGLVILLFCGVALGFGIYYFIPFINRKNLNIIYYTMNIPKTEPIDLEASNAAFSIGFQCDESDKYSAEDIFEIHSKFVIYTKNSQDDYNKKKVLLTWHYCTHKDFYNKYNESLDYLKIDTYQCLDDHTYNIEGIFSDKVFSYYEFSVTSKNNTKENYDIIYQYLLKNDCKLVLYYTDVTVDLAEYKEPIKPFLNSIFIQLNPILDIKRNIYFMKQYLFDDDSFFAVFQGDEKPRQIETLYSRYEEYAYYKGLNWGDSDNEFAKVFIRADTKKTIIKRTYQKVTEFYADSSSLLIAFYEILIIIFTYIDNFYAEQSISKRLFFFKEYCGKKPLKYSKIIQIVNTIDTPDFDNLETIQDNINNLNNNNFIEINSNRIKTPHSIRKNKKYEKYINDESSKGNKLQKNFSIEKNDSTIRKVSLLINENEHGKQEKIYKRDLDLKSSRESYNINNKKSILIDTENIQKNVKNSKSKTIIKYSFNFFEIFAIKFCPKCIKGKLDLKNKLNSKANELLYYKLDICLYLRNMFLFDIFNQFLIETELKEVINFLSRPMISVNKETKKFYDEIYYKNFDDNNFDKLYESILNIKAKYEKGKKGDKLIKLANIKLKEFL